MAIRGETKISVKKDQPKTMLFGNRLFPVKTSYGIFKAEESPSLKRLRPNNISSQRVNPVAIGGRSSTFGLSQNQQQSTLGTFFDKK